MKGIIGLIHWVIEYAVRHKAQVFAVVFCGCVAGYWCMSTLKLDAVPDLGDTQVIIYSRWDRSPELIESQVTYPIVTALLGAPHVKTVRGVSDFGYSFVYVIFEDNTDLYWARSRTMEYLSGVQSQLPDGVKTQIGPDATSLGWIFQYALVDKSGKLSTSQLSGYQDWYLRYYLKAVPGVADVAAAGELRRQYQVNVDPNRLRNFGISISQVVDAVREGNVETSGRLLEFGGTEYMVRGRGYAKTLDDFRNIAVPRPVGSGRPDSGSVRLRDLGEVTTGPDLRRGVTDLDGQGDVVSGIVMMRSGENALEVIDRVKAKLKEIEPSLPQGVEVVPIYDRSTLIHRTIGSVRLTIFEVIITVALVILIFLWHFPSAIIPLVTMPAAILISFIPLRLLGISANVMSLAGVAIAFGELVDASILIVEQSYKRLEQWEATGCRGRQSDIVLGAVKEVAGPIVFCLLLIAVSVLPVFALEGQEGRMFRPLAYTKSLAMIVAAVMAITLDPALRLLLTKARRFEFGPQWVRRFMNALTNGRIRREEQHPISGPMVRVYEPVVRWTLRYKWVVIGCAAAMIAITVPVFLALGSEFMPAMNEGTILYMPTTMPGISVNEAQKLLIATDSILKQFPEVDRVLGKAGRADTPTDPAPLSMLETLITLKPQSDWRKVDTWYSSWAPEWTRPMLRPITPDTISPERLVREMNASLQAPGVSNAWTTPIKGRIDMLTSGIRTPVGLKISGRDVETIEAIGNQVQAILPSVRGTANVFSEHTNSGYFIDIEWRRDQLARYGISMAQAQRVVENGIGGDNVSTVSLGPERYAVNVRYMPDFRSSIDALKHVLVSTPEKGQVEVGELATLQMTSGPSMIRDEDGLLTGYVYVDLAGRDPGSYVAEANKLLHQKMSLPPGFTVTWSGQYQDMQRANERLKIAIPLTLAAVVFLIYLSTGAVSKTLIVLLAVPFSAVGSIWLLYLLHFNLSVAVWVGLAGLLSIDAETGIFMLLYLDLSYDEAMKRGQIRSIGELREVIVDGAARRLRPKFMTFATICIGLLPVMWSTGTGSEVMKRIAAPMAGGIVTSFLLELLVYPAVYELWRRRSLPRQVDPDEIESSSRSKLYDGERMAVSIERQLIGMDGALDFGLKSSK
ncbi:Cu(I)/Ag(I) efflux system membrane protein CusA/SilA [Granulicella aggregans]|uniref:Cu(I)/Ag(I) efflux system membrane protein CusA/SilA n=1 Tax=Granulicella aggregans TaxID=474949 RepID=A0A7W7ZF99_9BACT|nr:CusA/CzcA family heavy metal efflux RND transporter [Granulicella aggregans]MBB5058732.1 Cu(I)/Ag(I) efflux system membrane protein CusA/SilA [Granulicella aggregans]